MYYDFYNGHIYNQKDLWTKDFIREHKHEIDWFKLTKKITLSEDFIEEMGEYINWKAVFLYQSVSEEFIKKHIDKLENFDHICAHRLPSIEFVKEYKNKFHWGMLSQQKLSDEFCRVFRDDIDWRAFTVNNCYFFTEQFMREFKDYIDWDALQSRIEISNNFKRELCFKITKSEGAKKNVLRVIGRNMRDNDWKEWNKNIDKGHGSLELALLYNHQLTEKIIIPNAVFFDIAHVRMMRSYTCTKKLKNFMEKYPEAFGRKYNG